MRPLPLLFSFLLLNAVLAVLLIKKAYRRKRALESESRSLQEQINIVNDQNIKELKNKITLQEKIQRYNSLKQVIENINRDLELDSTANSLSSIAFSLIASNKGTSILYLLDPNSQRLMIVKTHKENKRLIIKAKEGDIFDYWVLRHAAPLFVEDARKDFRFDPERLKMQDVRPIASLISAPLITDHRFLGILRLDNEVSHFYTQDDLRLLVTIGDVGAVALENGELFKKTRDMAIHDGLTSLFTKGYFLERLEEECKRSVRQGAPFSLFMLDIDYFKNYNDKFGHTAGDIVLKQLSLDMAGFLKDLSPFISRFGGEEFCIMLPRLTKKEAFAMAKELCARVEGMRIDLRREMTKITVSIGVATFPDDAKDGAELIKKADHAMYEAKQKGRNRACRI